MVLTDDTIILFLLQFLISMRLIEVTGKKDSEEQRGSVWVEP